jgi:hypothetical protein
VKYSLTLGDFETFIEEIRSNQDWIKENLDKIDEWLENEV